MDIKFLGTWSSNLIVGERNITFLVDNNILFDFSPHALESLLEMHIDPNSISILLISHMHLDHYMGIAELLWYRSIYKAKNSLLVMGPKGIKENTENLLKAVHTPGVWYKEQIDTNVEFKEDTETDSIEIFPGNHTIPDNGYRLSHNGKTIFYSGDTSYSKSIVEGATGVDYLIHETTYTDNHAEEADFWHHSTFSNTLRVYKESKAKHLIPVHLKEESRAVVMREVGNIDGLIPPVKQIFID